mmetsp:Transcript_5517/g.34134  ORF Transcript_5517/g.34134 Transcript_5517/m.34134 type:complete len:206 (+) Transcript_5517:993-1610(+)
MTRPLSPKITPGSIRPKTESARSPSVASTISPSSRTASPASSSSSIFADAAYMCCRAAVHHRIARSSLCLGRVTSSAFCCGCLFARCSSASAANATPILPVTWTNTVSATLHISSCWRNSRSSLHKGEWLHPRQSTVTCCACVWAVQLAACARFVSSTHGSRIASIPMFRTARTSSIHSFFQPSSRAVCGPWLSRRTTLLPVLAF